MAVWLAITVHAIGIEVYVGFIHRCSVAFAGVQH